MPNEVWEVGKSDAYFALRLLSVCASTAFETRTSLYLFEAICQAMNYEQG